MVWFLSYFKEKSDHEGRSSHAVGTLTKRSKWLKRWNVRHATVLQPPGSPGSLEWFGGAQAGSIVLDAACTVRIDGECLIVSCGREWHFRAAPGGESERLCQRQPSVPGRSKQAAPVPREVSSSLSVLRKTVRINDLPSGIARKMLVRTV